MYRKYKDVCLFLNENTSDKYGKSIIIVVKKNPANFGAMNLPLIPV